jgi:hypothetical protein
VSKNLFDVDRLGFVVDAGNQSVVVAADIENRAFPIDIR